MANYIAQYLKDLASLSLSLSWCLRIKESAKEALRNILDYVPNLKLT